MPRGRSQLAFPVALVVTLAVALLPADARLGWSREIGEIVKLVLVPVSHPLRLVSHELRPPPSPVDGVDRAELAAILEQQGLFEQMYHQLKGRVEELEEENRQLQNLPPETIRHAKHRFSARVGAGNANSIYGPLTLQLGTAAARDVVPGTIAVSDGVHLLGRTVGEPGRATCVLEQIVEPSSKVIRAEIVPHGDPAARGLPVQIAPTGAGTLEGKVNRDDVAGEGDIVRLADSNWPRTAQGMVIGSVESLRIDDGNPLRKVVVVRPRVLASQVSSVILIVEAREPGGDAP